MRASLPRTSTFPRRESPDLQPPAIHTTPHATNHNTTRPLLPIHDVPDLRRGRDLNHIDTLLDRAALLAEADRILLHAILRSGISVAALARSTNLDPTRLRRRTHALLRRLISRDFRAVAHLLPKLRGPRREVARLCFLQGRPIREVAATLALSLHAVRRHRQAVAALLEVQSA